MLCVKVYIIVFALAIAIKSCSGIHCWVCDGKRTLKACHAQYGRMLKCPNDDDVCQNDYRTAEGKPLITKGCKQATACETEVKQNKDKNQCGRKKMFKNMVCRCCCTTDGCNSKESGCIPPPAPCKKIRNIPNGQTTCPTDIGFGSRCFFRCNQGYARKGPQRATCARISKESKKGKWAPEDPPVCEKIIIKCDPPRMAPENGFIKCENTKEYQRKEEFNYEGSKCMYGCDKNYYLQGKKNTVCGTNRKWSSEDPTCQKGVCEITQEDPNRIQDCTDDKYFGSKCTFTCKKGYNLIGSKTSECRQSGDTSRGSWSNSFPQCAEVQCYPKLTNPSHGEVSCTKENAKGSVCTYTCNKGYDMSDTEEKSVQAVCEDAENGGAIGKWSRDPPTCRRIICEPAFKDPNSGQVVCTDSNRYGSECAFSCLGGFDLDGTTEPTWTSTCQDDGDGDHLGKWSEAAADCKPITCQPELVAERNEKLSCSNFNGGDSICTFECADDYDLDGTTQRYVTSVCLPPKDGTSVGKWSRTEKPKCVPITCPPMPFPDNGFRICSTFNYMRGTFCIFYCDDGYDRVGASYMSCQKSKKDGVAAGEWTAPPPTCRLGQCQATKYNKETVVEECTPPEGFKVSEYRVGTVCRYRCISDAYYMVPNTDYDPILSGVVTSECNTEKKWTVSTPRCLLKSCRPALTALPFGYNPKCTNGNAFGSLCEFSCQEKYAPSHDRPLVCQADGDNDQYGKWSEPVPTCERSHCDEFGTVINGRLNCTDGTRIGSICSLECIDRYVTKRYEETECLPSITWSQRRFFCCVRCLFNRRIKIAAVLDQSTFRTRADWRFAIDFTKAYLSQMVRYDLEVSFSAITYANEVDEETEIPMERLRTQEDVERVAESMGKMKYGGSVSNTGKALEYVSDVTYSRFDSRREHFVILTTRGRSNDNTREIARRVRGRNINILATGIQVDNGGRRQLLDITGKESNIFTAKSFEDMRSIPAQIFQISKSTGCTTASKTQACP